MAKIFSDFGVFYYNFFRFFKEILVSNHNFKEFLSLQYRISRIFFPNLVSSIVAKKKKFMLNR